MCKIQTIRLLPGIVFNKRNLFFRYFFVQDYENYVVVYTCGLLGAGSVIQTAHMMTRTPESLDRAQREAVLNFALGGLGGAELLGAQHMIGKETCPMVAQTALGQARK